MTTIEDQIRNKYFDWLYNYVCKGRIGNNISYRKLFKALHSIEFDFYIPKDINRARDGIDLRYRFALSINDENLVMDILDEPCSVLEMLVALAIRCEETIMDDTRYGDRTGQWFWSMLSNLGISYMTDENFDEKILNKVIYDFMERRYSRDGKGGLFYIRNSEEDLRDVEIWTQLCWYLNNFT